MKVLFVHQNFPAQFVGVASALAGREGHEVVAIGSQTARALPNVRLVRYTFGGEEAGAVHPFARRFETEVRRAEQIMYLGGDLIASGFVPDLVFVHCGWGEHLPLRTLFPAARMVTYLEYFYRPDGLDTNFDPEWPRLSLDGAVGLRAKNAATLLGLADTDVAISPTEWQRSTFPAAFRPLIDVCHEGVDVDRVRPDGGAVLHLDGGPTLRAGEEVVTYVSRNLEPLRGYHTFMRSLAAIQRGRPKARIVVVGGDGVSYGAAPPRGATWKQVFLDEHRRDLDLSRVHFLGRVDYATYLRVLQVSAVHVYLTYPFVLSWSLLEAMAAGCLVVGSATGPVTEVIDGSNGLLVDFFDPAGLADRVRAALADPARHCGLRARARSTVVERYDRADCVDRLLRLAGAAQP